METVTIAREEYDKMKEVVIKISLIDNLIHESRIEEDLLKLSESTAQEIWDNEYDEIWNTV